MVAMAIGIVLIGVVGSIFLGSRNTFTSADQRGRTSEASRLVNDIFGSMVRQAGYVDIANTTSANHTAITFPTFVNRDVTGITAIFGCADGRVNYSLGAWSCTANPVVAGQLPSDAIAFSYQSQPAANNVQGSSLTGFASGIGGDCNGQDPMAGAAGAGMPTGTAVAINEFYIGRGVVTTQGGQSVSIPELYCLGNGNPAAGQPIAQGPEQIRAVYTVLQSGLPGFEVYRRLTTAQMAGSGIPDVWEKVRAVELCVLIQTPARVAGSGVANTYVDCDGTSRTATDSRLRKANWYAFNLRNRTTTSPAI